jgi:signal transduction histidine kinase/ActR/RegA family two-component response regulator
MDMSKCRPKVDPSPAAGSEAQGPLPADGSIVTSARGLADSLHKAISAVGAALGLGGAFRWVAAGVAIIVAQAAACAVLGPGNRLTAYAFITLFLLMLTATGAAAFNAFTGGRGSRSFWTLLALGLGIWALDQWLWIYYRLRLHTDVPNESIGDPALFLHTVPLMAALATRPHLTRRLHQTSFSFLLLLFFWVFLYAYFVFPHQFLFSDPNIYWVRYNFLYFSENIALLVFAGVLILRSDRPWKLLYAQLFGAAGLYALTSEWVNTAINSGGAYYPGAIYDLGFTGAACGFILAAVQGGKLPPGRQRPMPFNTRLARYAGLLAIMGVVMVPLVGIWTLYRADDPLPLQRVHLLIILLFAITFTALVFLQMYVANQDLHREIAVRLQAEEGLREATAAAEAGNRAKAEFLANMSHEIRTPMNGILGMTDIALETQLTPEQREYLQMTKSSAESLMTIINDILDFSKVDAGKLEMESIEFDLRDLLSQCAKTFARKAAENGVNLTCVIRPEVPDFVLGDPTRLRQVVVNLLGNALKFTPKGEIALQAQREPSASGQVLLHFSVRDTGVGIPAEKQHVIFAPFAQADGSTTRKFGGTGLGLTISSRLVQLMGGAIWVESQVGAGSTFHFTACFGRAQTPHPLLAADGTALPSKPAESAGLASPNSLPAECHGLRILLAEDNLVNQRVALRLLEKHGHCVALATNGRQALDALLWDHFDVVLMDVQMPEMDGLEATAAIREEEKKTGAHLPIIAMTAHSMKGDREECLAAGMDGYVAKPIRSEELFAVIEEVTSRLKPPPPPPIGKLATGQDTTA